MRVRVPSQATCKSLAWNASLKGFLPQSEAYVSFLSFHRSSGEQAGCNGSLARPGL